MQFKQFKVQCKSALSKSSIVSLVLAFTAINCAGNSSNNDNSNSAECTLMFGRQSSVVKDIVTLSNDDSSATLSATLDEVANVYWSVIHIPNATASTKITFGYDPRYTPPIRSAAPIATVYTGLNCPLNSSNESFMLSTPFSNPPTYMNYTYDNSSMTIEFSADGDFTIVSGPAMLPMPSANYTVRREN